MQNGVSGKNGYIHIAYADSSDGKTGFDTVNGTNKKYIGQYSDNIETDSKKPTDYTWSKIKGDDGKTPVKGVDYFDGTSSYLWIRYSANSDGSGMTTTPSANTKYIGTATTTTNTAPTAISNYKWSKYVGENGTPGKNGYIHIAYADSADGRTGFDKTVGTGKKYIGQYTDNIETDSDDPTKYTWTLIKGTDGKTGVGVKRLVPEYAISTSSTTAPTSGWGTTEPKWTEGNYIWTRSRIELDNGTTNYSTAILANAMNDALTKDGINLIRESETLSFDGYIIGNVLADASGNVLTDASGNILVA